MSLDVAMQGHRVVVRPVGRLDADTAALAVAALDAAQQAGAEAAITIERVDDIDETAVPILAVAGLAGARLVLQDA